MSTTEPKNGSAVHRTAQLSVQSASADASRLHPTYPYPVLEHKTAGEHRPHCKGEIQVSGTLHIKLNSFQGCYGLIWQKTMKYIHNLC